MIQRDDIHGEPQAPESYKKFILEAGGVRPGTEESLYRLVHTATRYMRQGGCWNEWRKGASVPERGGFVEGEDGAMIKSPEMPVRQVVELREVKKYPLLDGWIIERWCPPYMYGTRETWEALHPKGYAGVPLLGPYPEQGDYEYVAGPTERLPEFSRIREAMQMAEFARNQHWGTVEDNVKQRVRDAISEFEAESEKFRKEVEAQVREAIIPMGRISLAAGRHRQALADRAGVREHAGN